ncbi:TetR family transcriptional regulator [Oerskovia turbata]
MSETPARRGRPAVVDPDRVAATALRLFAEEGFGNVTMDDVARACGVGRRTLFRLFPSKAALVWGGAVEARDEIADALAHAPATTLSEALDGVRAAFVTASSFAGDAREVTRQRLRLIADDEDLLAWGTSRHAAAASVVAEHLDRAEGLGEPSLRARTLAAACAAATFAALVWWAQSAPDRDPAHVVDEALTALFDGPGAWTAQT